MLYNRKKCTLGPRYWYASIVRYWNVKMYQYRSILVRPSQYINQYDTTSQVYQYRLILVYHLCTSIGRYQYIMCVPVSVDNGTIVVYQYRSILGSCLCTSIGRHWNVSVYHIGRYQYIFRKYLCIWCISSPPC